jgi:hypothetical protein
MDFRTRHQVKERMELHFYAPLCLYGILQRQIHTRHHRPIDAKGEVVPIRDMKPHSRRRSMAPLILNSSNRWRWYVSMSRPLYILRKAGGPHFIRYVGPQSLYVRFARTNKSCPCCKSNPRSISL